MLTPNADSPLRRHYGRNWRGLDAPRHLQIFTSRSLGNLAKSTGYTVVETFTSMNGFVYQDLASEELATGKKHLMGGPVAIVRRILCHVKAVGLGWRGILSSGRDGEEVVLVCRK